MATLAEQLVEAQAAYHALQIGKAAASFRDSNGEMVTYSAADTKRLALYIRDLERQIAGQPPIRSIKFSTSKGF